MAKRGRKRGKSSRRSWAQAFRFTVLYLILITSIVFIFREQETLEHLFFRARVKVGEMMKREPAPTSAHLEEISTRVVPTLEQALAEKGLRAGYPVYIRAFKESSELEMWMEKPDGSFELFRTWKICRWSGDLGPKLKEGDGQTPEGFYYVTPSAMKPDSEYHLAFNIGFPNRYDRNHGRTGSLIMVHGACVSIGCLAMTNAGIEEIYSLAEAALDGGQEFFRIHIFPFRMTDDRMDQAVEGDSPWLDFWINLKEGYDFFEIVGRPPNTELEDGEYVFE